MERETERETERERNKEREVCVCGVRGRNCLVKNALSTHLEEPEKSVLGKKP